MKLVIFGCGIIANRIAKSCKLVDGLELVGFGSKSIDKAKEYALKYECKDYGNYEHFLNNPDIDAVYIATYNLSHYELTKECILHNKSVICEKPMFSSILENEELFELARIHNVTLMEAMKAVFLPLIVKTREIVKEGKIGDITDIYASFQRAENFGNDHYIFDLNTGGALKDIGSYCAAVMNFIMDEDPEVIKRIDNRSDLKAERSAEVILKYGSVKGKIKVSSEYTDDSMLKIVGTKGELVIDNFWKNNQGYYIVNNQKYELNEEMISDFYYEIRHFKNLVENGILESDIMSKKASNRILKITCTDKY